MRCWREAKGFPRCGEGDAVLLDTATHLQRDEYSCGATCARVLYEWHGLTMPRAFASLSNPARGMSPETAEAAIRAAFPGVAWGQGWAVADLAHHLRLGRPVMCLVSGAEPADHWVLVRGWHGGRVHYHDPAAGRGSKPAAEWLTWWAGPAGNAYARFGLTGWL